MKINILLSDFKKHFFCNDQYIMDVLQIKAREYNQKIMRNSYSIHDVLKITKHFNINIEEIESGEINYSQLKKRFFSPSTSLPDKYTLHAGTYMSVIRSMIMHIQSISNADSAQHTMNKFSLSKEVIINDDLVVNLKLGNDILEYIHSEYRLKEANYISMALGSYDSIKRQTLLNSFSGLTSNKSIVKALIANSSKIEKNFSYSVEDYNKDYFIIKSKSKPEMNEFFAASRIAMRPGLLMKAATIKVVTHLLNRRMVTVDHIQDFISKGSHHTNYFIRHSNLSHSH